MTVKELKKIVDAAVRQDPDMRVICDRYSDYCDQEPPEVMEVLPPKDGVYTRYYESQWPKDAQPDRVRVLHFQGN